MMKRLASTLLLTALFACAQLGLEPPKSFGESLAYSYSQNTAIRQSASSALQTGTITKADAQQVLTTTDTVRSALDEGRKLGCPGAQTALPTAAACLDGSLVPATALGKLQLASGLLATVQTFLTSKGVK